MLCRRLILFLLSIPLLLSFAFNAYAHPGGTDENGGHIDKETGEFHYHHGYPAHDHYDLDGDGIIDCPYDFDEQADTSRAQNKDSNNRYHQYSDEEYTEPESEHNKFGIYLIAFGISLAALLSAFLLRTLREHLEYNNRFPFLSKALDIICLILFLFSFGLIALIAVVYFLVKSLCEIIAGTIRDRRIKKCKKYAKNLIKAIEVQDLESCSNELLLALHNKIYCDSKDFRAPFETIVQFTLLSIVNQKIKSQLCSDQTKYSESYFYQLRSIRVRLYKMLKTNGYIFDI